MTEQKCLGALKKNGVRYRCHRKPCPDSLYCKQHLRVRNDIARKLLGISARAALAGKGVK